MTFSSLTTPNVKPIRKMAAAVVLVLVTVSLLSLTRWCAAASPLVASLFVEEQKLTASDGVFGDGFGHSVAFSGSILVSGTPRDEINGNSNQGSVYVFNRVEGGWVETQKLTASDGEAGDNFGWTVAVSGSTIVVGAWHDDIGGNPDQGSVYVFNLQDGAWVETQKLIGSSGAANDLFSFSLAFSGSTIVVGSLGDNSARGAVYVFNSQGRSWVEEQKLTASDGAAGDGFGQSVAFSGSSIVASSPGDDIFKGAVYVFNRQRGSWVEEQKLTASDGAPVDFFGSSVAISGSTIVVGATNDDFGGRVDPGSAYVFNRQEGSWAEEQKLTASDLASSHFFGWSVAVSGSTIVVGVPFERMGGDNTPGSAYVFDREGAEWVETQKLTPSDGAPQDFFSFAAAISGSTIIVGAENNGPIVRKGSVYVFER